MAVAETQNLPDNPSATGVVATDVTTDVATVPAVAENALEQNQDNLLVRGLRRLSKAQQFFLLISVAATIAIIVVLLVWSAEPSYKMLYGKLSPQAAGEIVSVLKQEKIPYKLDDFSGQILVPGNRIHDVRLLLASQGLPNNEGSGFEILDQKQGFGTSQFIEKVRYHRALEGELARSITQLKNIDSARVHLAIPKRSVFVRDRRPPSASVLINLRPGKTLDSDQVSAVVHMVASSISELQSHRITVVDQTGRMLTKPEKMADLGLSSAQFEFKQSLENAYIERIERILSPIVGFEGVRAQVNASVDFSITEVTEEKFDPNVPSIRSEQIMEEERRGGDTGGVPGALTNQPPGTAIAPENALGENGVNRGAPSSKRRQSTLNYELDKMVSHTRQAPGSLQRLSVAVVVDDKARVDENDVVVRTALTPEELNRISDLVKEAVGFDSQRGDSLNVLNATFYQEIPIPPAPEEPVWEQSWFVDFAKQGLGVFAAILAIMLILRPIIKALTHKEEVLPPGTKIGEDGEPILPTTPQAEDEALEAVPEMDEEQRRHEEDMKQKQLEEEDLNNMIGVIKKVVADDPKLVAQVIKNWIADDER